MSIAGHVSRAMLSRYAHVRMEAKRRALDAIASRQRTAMAAGEAQTNGAAGQRARVENPSVGPGAEADVA